MIEHWFSLLLGHCRLGIPSFKEEQEKAISSFISGWQTCFVSLPTGYGKSACFDCLPVMFDCLRRVLADDYKQHSELAIQPLST